MSLGTPIYCKKHRHSDLDSCEYCDKERENTKYSRAFQLVVYVDRIWLTNGFEFDEASGWEVLQEDLEAKIKRHRPSGTKVEFDGWTEEPVEL